MIKELIWFGIYCGLFLAAGWEGMAIGVAVIAIICLIGHVVVTKEE